MADNITDNITEAELSKKRGRSEVSSVSDLDSSMNTPPNKKKDNKKKNGKDKGSNSNSCTETQYSENFKNIHTQLAQINHKLSNVMTKEDGNLRSMIREMIQEMKEELLKSVEKKIEVLEGSIFEKEQENDQLKSEVTSLNKMIEEKDEQNKKLRWEVEKNNENAMEYMNDLEQYSRSNNIRISGVVEEHEKENADKTTQIVIKTLNEKIPNLQLKESDIDISHRLGKKLPGKKRQIIVKFVSRAKKNKIMRNVKKFKGSKMFLSEDLTKLNHQVLACIRNKMPDEVNAAWTVGGTIYYEDNMGAIHTVRYSEYEHWFDLPWPKQEETTGNKTEH